MLLIKGADEGYLDGMDGVLDMMTGFSTGYQKRYSEAIATATMRRPIFPCW